MEIKKMTLVQLFLSFFKIGVIGFGGGSALIPVVEKELVEDRAALAPEEYTKHTVIANITPGALPVKLGATCGYQLCGVAGSLVGAWAVMLPGVLLTVAIMSLFSVLGASAIQYFNYASVGITAFIVFLLVSYLRKTVAGAHFKVNAALCAAAFLLTGGKELRQVLGLLFGAEPSSFGVPLFDISTIDLMLVTFFMILVLEKLKKPWELWACFGLGAVYSFLVGKTGASLGLSAFGGWALAAMGLVLAGLFLLRRRQGGTKAKLTVARSAWLTVAIFLAIPVAVTVAVSAMGLLDGGHSAPAFVGNVCVSTVTSFGGGEAYVSVADGIFVQGGYLPPELFYTRLVPVANALPGPILVKIAAGIGYLFGLAEGSALAGWMLAGAAAAAAVGCCSALAVLVMQLYDSIGHSQFIRNLKTHILPVICGMLLSTSCAMLYEAMKITGEKGISSLLSLPLLVLAIWTLHTLHKRFHLHDILLLLGAAAISLVGLLLL